MNIATCIKLKYKHGDHYLTQGHKNNPFAPSTLYTEDNYTVKKNGFGWGHHFKGSKLILTVELSNQVHEIWVDSYFKNNIGNLTEKRRNIIKNTMPDCVEVRYYEKKDGDFYLKVTDESLAEWCKQVRYYL